MSTAQEGAAIHGRIDDIVLPFRLENLPVRGRLVRLAASVDTVLTGHDYPETVSRLVGETLVLVSMLGPALKFDGILTVQLQGDGPISVVVADYATPRAVRAYASFDAERVSEIEGREHVSIGSLLGRGALTFTLDPRLERERYQSVVALDGDTLSDCARTYFAQSEQLPTVLSLAVARHFEPAARAQSVWRAGGLMLQHVPESGGRAAAEAGEDAWRYVEAVTATLGLDELVDPTLSPERLLFRLFHEAGVRTFAPQTVQFECRCSEERIRNVLTAYSRTDLSDMVESDGLIGVRCEFCSRKFRLDPDSLA